MKINNRIKEGQYNAYTQSTITILASIIFIAFAIHPTVTKAFDTKTNLDKYNEYDQLYQEKVENLETAKEIHKQYETEIKLIEKLVPSTPEEGNLINVIQEKGARNNVIIKRIDFSHPIKSDNSISFNELPFQIEMQGTYDNFFKFTKDIKNSGRLIKIDSLQIKIENREAQILSISMSGKSYYKPRPDVVNNKPSENNPKEAN